ncbi:MAG: hypothetical protein PHN31_01475 [Candidatus Gracilibacteria bacterium]|nr:hypothetical protein [Candidatus Gracilibacteria bacterium]
MQEEEKQTSNEVLTPAMRQYKELKEKYSDAILFFRMGDFYEMFGEDALIAHNVLGIAITSRNKNAKNPDLLAGIPYHAKEKYLPKLVEAGYKVAVAEQVSDPKLKGIVEREVQRVVTPATLYLEGEEYAKENISNYIISIVYDETKYGLSILDFGTNKWVTAEFDTFEKLSLQIYKISPKEVILEKKLFSDESIKELLSKKYSLNIYYFEGEKESKEKLLSHFGVKNLSGFGLDGKLMAIKASSLLLEYLELNQKSSLDFLQSLSYETFSNYLDLDESTIRNLDLIYNFATKSHKVGTLFGVLDDTKTAMGTRYLREAILKPLQSKEEIDSRLDMVEEFLNNPVLLDKVQNHLKYVSDIDAILNRLALNRSGPKDLLNLKKSLEEILEVFKLIEQEGSEKLRKLLVDSE